MITSRDELSRFPRDRYVYYPGTAEVPESQAVTRNRWSRSGRRWTSRQPVRRGPVRARVALRGARAVLEGRNRASLRLQLRRDAGAEDVGSEDVPTGEKLLLSASFDKDGEDRGALSTGILSLYHGDKGKIAGEAGSRRSPESS